MGDSCNNTYLEIILVGHQTWLGVHLAVKCLSTLSGLICIYNNGKCEHGSLKCSAGTYGPSFSRAFFPDYDK